MLVFTPAPSGYRAHLAYVVEGHASACPRTVGVVTLCDVVIRTMRERRGLVRMITVKKVNYRVPEGKSYFLKLIFCNLILKNKKIDFDFLGSYQTLNAIVS